MLIVTEVPEATFLFKLYHGRRFLKDLAVSSTEIVTSEDLPEFRNKRLSLSLQDSSRTPLLEISQKVLINGVACRNKRLKTDDTIFLGPYRLVFVGVYHGNKERDGERVLKKENKRNGLPYIAEAAILLLSLSFLWYCTTQIPVRKSGDSGLKARLHEAPPPESASGEEKSAEESGIPETVHHLAVYAPDNQPVPQKVDILLMHAHPDDETLDYGLLIAEAADSGKSVGVITFTDGESGFDFYPDRRTDGIYSDRELSGRELAEVRVKEEEAALKLLGASVYVRLGLKNRPYTPEEASKPVSLIIEEWGGKEYLVDRLVNLITAFSPDIIVSPDGPSRAREHFEHEAAGFLCDLAVHSYITSSPGKLHAYLKLVDVQQLEAYPDAEIMCADSGKKYVDRKRAALMQYQTQADACYYGVKRLEEYPCEYYFTVYDAGDMNLALSAEKNREERQ